MCRWPSKAAWRRWRSSSIQLATGYSYDSGFSVNIPSSRGEAICKLGAEAHAAANVWLQTPLGKINVIDTGTELTLYPDGRGQLQSHSTILEGIQLYNPI